MVAHDRPFGLPHRDPARQGSHRGRLPIMMVDECPLDQGPARLDRRLQVLKNSGATNAFPPRQDEAKKGSRTPTITVPKLGDLAP